MKALGILIVAIFVFNFAHANTYVIPNPYKNQRLMHKSPVATAWGRKELAGFEYLQTKINIIDDDITIYETDIEAFKISPYLLGDLKNGFKSEIKYSAGEVSVDSDVSGASRVSADSNNLEVNVGFNSRSSPFAFGLRTTSFEENYNAVDTDNSGYGTGLGFRFGENQYLGFGVENINTIKDARSKYKKNIYLGYGVSNALGLAGEIVLQLLDNEYTDDSIIQLQGRYNFGGSEIKSEITHTSWKSSGNNGEILAASLGYDYSFNNFYFAPQIKYNNGRPGDSTNIFDTDETFTELEMGYRSQNGQYYISAQSNRYKRKMNNVDAKYEVDEDTVIVGFNKFL